MFAEALKLLGAKRAFVVHGHDGLDEISICAPTRVSELKDGVIRTYDISPEQFFGKSADAKNLVGGTAEENADITRRILSGEKGPCRDVVLINTSAALMAAGMVENITEGIEAAAAAIDQGKASEKLGELVAFTKKHSA